MTVICSLILACLAKIWIDTYGTLKEVMVQVQLILK